MDEQGPHGAVRGRAPTRQEVGTARSCPERILKLLTPTDHQSSNEWRAACWANIEKRKDRKNLPAGTVLKYGRNLLTIEGPWSLNKNKTVVWGPQGQQWLMSRSQILAAEIVSRPEQANV